MTKPYYGGQAVLEGVMMQGPKGKAIVCRDAQGRLVRKISSSASIREKYPILKCPIIRGCIAFGESLIKGMQDITWSAAQAGESEEDQLSKKDMAIAIILAVVLTVVLFIAIPVFAANYIRPYVGDFGRSLAEGLLRLAIFIGYVVAISRMSDIKRLFQYHGAEHKTIFAYEAGKVLTVENVRPYTTIHPRCGTSFLLMAMIIMIIVFTFVGRTDPLERILIKILCMPIVAGVSFEVYRLPLKFPNNIFVRALTAPGMWMQRLTTSEPDDGQLAVAIASITSVPGFPQEQIASMPEFYDPTKDMQAAQTSQFSQKGATQC